MSKESDLAQLVVMWKRAFTIERERAKEFIELYESMGYEVKVVDAKSCERTSECGVCYLGGDYVEIWIRKKDEEDIEEH